MKALRSRSTKTGSAWPQRISRAPRVTIVVILDAAGDLPACLARISSQCERTGTDSIVVSVYAGTIDESALSRRVRLVAAPADASRAELRHLGMQHAEGDIVLLEDITPGTGERSLGESFSLRDLADRARMCAPLSEWRDILLAHGVAQASPPRPSSRGTVRADGRLVRETRPIMADAHHPA